MPELVWDKAEDRVFEAGLDRGVLYLPDGSGVPWNGLTSVVEKADNDVAPIYYDGMKIGESVTLGNFSAAMKAVTYPEEFLPLEGLVPTRTGLFYGDQPPQVFGLCYRTLYGNILEGTDAGYKLHILYNVTAVPKEKTYASLTDSPSLVEFEWELTATPEEVPGFRPTAHIIIDTRDIDPLLLEEIEKILYGTKRDGAHLIPMPELVEKINAFLRVRIIDNGDGTWTAITNLDEYLDVDSEGLFEINGVNAWYLDEDTYQVSSTTGSSDVPLIKIHQGEEVWTATSDSDALIVEVEPGMFQILNANTFVVDEDYYQISDTLDEE